MESGSGDSARPAAMSGKGSSAPSGEAGATLRTGPSSPPPLPRAKLSSPPPLPRTGFSSPPPLPTPAPAEPNPWSPPPPLSAAVFDPLYPLPLPIEPAGERFRLPPLLGSFGMHSVQGATIGAVCMLFGMLLGTLLSRSSPREIKLPASQVAPEVSSAAPAPARASAAAPPHEQTDQKFLAQAPQRASERDEEDTAEPRRAAVSRREPRAPGRRVSRPAKAAKASASNSAKGANTRRPQYRFIRAAVAN
jgi:hypothetical protein